MKIWIIYQHAISPAQAGGTRHFEFARECLAQGHEPLIVSSSFHHFSRRETRHFGTSFVETATEQGVPFAWIKTPSYHTGKLGRFLGMAKFAWDVWRAGVGGKLGRPDLIVGSTPPMFSPYAGLRLARHFGVPFVLEVRDIWPDTIVTMLGYSRLNPFILFLSALEKALYKGARRVVTVLPGSQRYLEVLDVPIQNIAICPNGIDMQTVPLPAPPAQTQPFTLIYSGHHGYANNLDTLVNAAEILQAGGHGAAIRFRLIGDGPYKDILMRMVADKGLQNVTFEPSLPKSEVHAELASAHGFIMILRPSDVFQWGISPNKLADYMACARPVLFGVSCEENPVRESGCGIEFDPASPEDMARAVLRLSAMTPAERHDMGMRGREYAVRHNDIRAIMRRMVRFVTTGERA